MPAPLAHVRYQLLEDMHQDYASRPVLPDLRGFANRQLQEDVFLAALEREVPRVRDSYGRRCED